MVVQFYLFTSDDLVTEIKIFTQTGQPYLTLVGLAAKANEAKIDVTSLEVTETDNSFQVICSGKNQQGITRWAAHEEFKSKSAKDEHTMAKAIAKAQRNLFKIFLYGSVAVKEAFAAFKEKGGNGNQNGGYQQRQQRQQRPPQQQAQPKQEAQPEQSPVEKKKAELVETQTRAIQAYEAHEASLATIGITKEIFWKEAVPAMYGVKGRDDMTLENWKNLIASLSLAESGENDGTIIVDTKKYPAWIQDRVPKEAESQTPPKETPPESTEPPPANNAEVNEEDIPF